MEAANGNVTDSTAAVRCRRTTCIWAAQRDKGDRPRGDGRPSSYRDGSALLGFPAGTVVLGISDKWNFPLISNKSVTPLLKNKKRHHVPAERLSWETLASKIRASMCRLRQEDNTNTQPKLSGRPFVLQPCSHKPKHWADDAESRWKLSASAQRARLPAWLQLLYKWNLAARIKNPSLTFLEKELERQRQAYLEELRWAFLLLNNLPFVAVFTQWILLSIKNTHTQLPLSDHQPKTQNREKRRIIMLKKLETANVSTQETCETDLWSKNTQITEQNIWTPQETKIF